MFHHLLFQLLDGAGDVFLAHVLDLGFLHGRLFQALGFLARLFAVHAVDQVFDLFDDALGRDAHGLVVRQLLDAATLGLAHGFFHGLGDAVGIQNRPPVQVAGCAADGLDQAALGPQEAFLVRVQNRHQRHLGNVQALAQQVDAHQHIKSAQAQVSQNFHPLHRVHVAVQVTHLHAVVAQIIGELLGHALGQCGDQHALVLVHTDADFLQHVVHLVGGGAHLDLRVHQPRGAHDLLNHFARMRLFIISGCGRDEDALAHAFFKLFELERAIVERAGQPKAVLHQRGFARLVAVVHGVELADHLVALVQKHDRVGRHVIGQGAGRVAGGSARQMPGVVLNAFAVPDFGQHFQIKPGALLQALGFDQLAHAQQFFEALGQLQLDGLHRRQHLVAWRHIVAGGVNRKTRDLLPDAARERVKQLQAFDFVVEQLNADGQFGMLGREDVDGVAAHAELAATELHVVALVLHADQLGDHVALTQLVAGAQRHDHAVVALGLADAVDGRHRGHNHHIAPLHDAFGARQTHLLNVLIDGRVFLDEQVALRHIGFGLVVVVVADEILHRVLGKELPELAVQLRGQCFIGRKHDGWPPQLGDHIGHGEGLTRAGHTQQGLEHLPVVHAFDQLLNGHRLVACRRIGLKELKRGARVADELPLGVLVRIRHNFNNGGFGHGGHLCRDRLAKPDGGGR